MNPAKQFWALFKFQSMMNPALWIMPLAFGFPMFLPLFIGSAAKSYHSDLSVLFINQNLIFVGILGAMILAPEKFQFGAVNIVSSYFGSEFLLTRAIDRAVLYRAKAALLYALILALPFISLVYSLQKPDLIVREYSQTVRQECLASVPGSTLLRDEPKDREPSLISIPHGNILIGEWQLSVFLITTIVLQLLILVLYPFKYAKWIFWAVFFGSIFYTVFEIGTSGTSLSEKYFFLFAGHQILFWCVTGMMFVLAQLWCERRFASLEQ